MQDSGSPPRLTHAERSEQFATRGVIELGQIDRAVAFVAQNFDERGPALLGRRLKLTLNDAKQMHLQRFDLEIFCVTAVRTRK